MKGETMKIEVLAVETNNGFYVSSKAYGFSNMLFDGTKPQKTFDSDWYFIKARPVKIEREVEQPHINHRFELIDTSIASDKIPAVLKREDAQYKVEGNSWEWNWKSEYETLASLYNLVSDPQPPVIEPVEFDFVVLLKVDSVPQIDFSYQVENTSIFRTSDHYVITRGNIEHQIIDRIVFPSVVLPSRPCCISSEDMYKIVREYVKNNINPKVAKITSDYDFCFTVKKRIPLAEPERFTVDLNNGLFQRRRRKPKYVTRVNKEREMECFEMTHDGHKYQGYTSIKGMQGENHADLKEKIDSYCRELIEFINTPLKDCPHCKGMGIILDESEKRGV